MPSFKNRWSGNPRSHSPSRLIPFLSFLFFSIWALSPATCWAQPPTTKPLLIQSWHRNINVTEPKPSIKHLLGSLDCFKSVFENFFSLQKCPLLIRLRDCTQAEIRTQTSASSGASEKFCICFWLGLHSLTVQMKRFNCLNVFEVSKLRNLKWSTVNSESEKNSTKSFLKS